jgi:hypothetical protein
MDVFVYHVKFLNLKLKMTDPIHSIYFSYQTLIVNQILYVLNIFCYFLVGRKSSLLDDPNCLNQVSLDPKNNQKI